MIYVSRTELPPLSEYTNKIKKIWQTRILTNDGEMVRELEDKLKEYWGVKNVICVSNGTLATMIALKALGIKKKLYVSPYSYISTVGVPEWMGIKTKFVDLDEKWKGPALVTHVYGCPQLVDIKPVIYDACHAFGVRVDGRSIMSYGDISFCSFHATKLFQTIEGGAIITSDDALAEKCRWMRNFGHNGKYDYFGAGINAKMNEFSAAMGLCMLPRVDKILKRYDKLIRRYNRAFNLSWECVSYYPVFFKSEEMLLLALEAFEKEKIYPRRYFYPPLNRVYTNVSCPVAEHYIKRVLCLPLYYSLKKADQDKVIKIAKEYL